MDKPSPKLPHPTVKTITISDDPKGLAVLWSDGFEGIVPFVVLRQECPCAVCKGERLPFDFGPTALPNNPPLPAGAAEPKDLFKVGSYAIGFRWGDGHDTGIYTFEYLRALAEKN
ncbi:MAG: DUF971 domain-containing protein [Deltaproteobacteria bacterium]|nr:DUF971 domain-containing protein [Deltaproteobacteria bacterium]